MRNRPPRSKAGLTLAEALIAIVVLAFTAVVVSGLYTSGLDALEAQNTRALCDSQLRSRMERLIAQKFDQLANGSEAITVGGTNYTVAWTVVTVDLDGDSTPEPTAKQITVTLDGRSLTTIVVDHEDVVRKL